MTIMGRASFAPNKGKKKERQEHEEKRFMPDSNNVYTVAYIMDTYPYLVDMCAWLSVSVG